MLRVTAVAKLVAGNMTIKVNTQGIVLTCLLHDMGNILKFNMDLFPESFEPEGRDYWAKIQQQYKTRYGSDENLATHAIARELKQSDVIIKLLKKMSFSESEQLYLEKDYDSKICAYADNRVGPFGVISLIDRLRDGQKRYEANHRTKSDHEFFEKMLGFAIKTETQIISKCKIKPEEITDQTAAPIISELQDFSI